VRAEAAELAGGAGGGGGGAAARRGAVKIKAEKSRVVSAARLKMRRRSGRRRGARPVTEEMRKDGDRLRAEASS